MCLLPRNTVCASGTLRVICSSMIFKAVFSVALMGNHRGTSRLCPQWCSVFNTLDTSSPETTGFSKNRLSKTHLKIRTDQMHNATSGQSHARASMQQHQFYNRWGNHRCALMRAAEAAQVVGTVLPLCACVAVDFKDTTFVSEWKSYELPLSTWDVQLSPGMQQR